MLPLYVVVAGGAAVAKIVQEVKQGRKPADKIGKLAQSSTNWSAEVGPYSTEEQALADRRRLLDRQFEEAMEREFASVRATPEEVLRIPSPPMADFIEGYFPMKQHVLVRFGKWREIIAQELPADRELYCCNVAMMMQRDL